MESYLINGNVSPHFTCKAYEDPFLQRVYTCLLYVITTPLLIQPQPCRKNILPEFIRFIEQNHIGPHHQLRQMMLNERCKKKRFRTAQ